MKKLDLISKRILVISLSISAVLLCATLLLFTARPAKAQTPSISSRMDDGRRYDAVAVGTNNAYMYFFFWNTQTGTYKLMGNAGIAHSSSEKFW